MAVPGLFSPQKIQETGAGGPGLQKVDGHNNATMIGNDERSTVGSSVSAVAAANGMSQGSKKLSDMFFDEHSMSGFNVNSLLDDGNTVDAGLAMKPKIVSSLEQTKGDILEDLLVNASEGQGNIGLQGSMGIASSPKTNGKDSVLASALPYNKILTCSLSLIESPSDVPASRPSTEEVIAFGRIPKPTLGVRSSTWLGG
jgi:hypothetical protein